MNRFSKWTSWLTLSHLKTWQIPQVLTAIPAADVRRQRKKMSIADRRAALKEKPMNKDRELKIIIKADGSAAITEVNNLDGGIENLGREVEKTSRKAKAAWADFAMGVNQALEVVGKGKQLLETVMGFAKQGAQLQEARQSFDNYARSVG